MPDGDLFLPQLENGFAAGPNQYNAADIIIGRIGANISAGATGSGVVGSQAWINSVVANTPSYSFAGVINEIIAFDRKLTEVERQQVYQYLSHKYNLSQTLPDSFAKSHNSAYSAGLTYWDIEHHPNTQGLSTIPAGICFGGITLQEFFTFPDSLYKSAGTVLADGTVLGGDTYSNIG